MLSDSDIFPAGVLVKTTLVDYPGRIAAVFFVEGCNLRCPYCYNADLVVRNKQYETVSFDEVLEHLIHRKNVLSGFVISGGEPLLYSSIQEIILQVRNLGYKVKLDTNGMMPDRLEYLIKSEACPDFIALDVKTVPERYTVLGSGCTGAANIRKSIQLLSQLPAEQREFRTVLVPSLVQQTDINIIASLLPQDAAWMMTNFRPGNCVDDRYNHLIPYTDIQVQDFVDYAKTLIPGSTLR